MDLLPSNFISSINAAVTAWLTNLSTYTLIVIGIVALATIIFIIISSLRGH